LYFTEPSTFERFKVLCKPSPSELAGLEAIFYLLEIVRFFTLAFIHPELPLLDKLELIMRGYYRLQLWFWDYDRRWCAGDRGEAAPPGKKERKMRFTSQSFTGFLQVSCESPPECPKPIFDFVLFAVKQFRRYASPVSLAPGKSGTTA